MHRPRSKPRRVPAATAKRLVGVGLMATALFTAPVSLEGVGTPTASAGTGQKLERLAVVDVQRCIMETTEGQRFKQELEREFSRKNARLEKKAKELQKKYEDLQAKQAVLSQQELQKRAMELMQQEAELGELSQKYSEELARKEALRTEQIYDNIAGIVKQIALEEKLQIVLVRADSTVLYANAKIDITNRVIVDYDKKFK